MVVVVYVTWNGILRLQFSDTPNEGSETVPGCVLFTCQSPAAGRLVWSTGTCCDFLLKLEFNH